MTQQRRRLEENGEWLNPETGEVHETPPLLVFPQQKWPEASVVVFQEAVLSMAQNPHLGGEALRVWMFLIGHVGFENWIVLRQSEIAERLGTQRPNVARAVKRLVTEGVLIEGAKLGRQKSYRLNSQVGWRGRVKTLHRHRQASKEPSLRVVQGGKQVESSRVEDARQTDLLINPNAE